MEILDTVELAYITLIMEQPPTLELKQTQEYTEAELSLVESLRLYQKTSI